MGFGKLGSLAMGGIGVATGNPYLIASGVGGFMSADEAERKQEQNKQYNLAQSELTRYSPWTGMRGQINPYSGPGEGAAAMGGAIQGASAAQGLSSLFSEDPSKVMNKVASSEGQMDASMFGNQQYQQQSNPWSKPDMFNQYTRRA